MKVLEWCEKSLIYFIWSALLAAIVFAVHELYWTIFFLSLLTFGLTFLPHLFDWHVLRFSKNFLLAIIFLIYATLLLGELGAFYQRFWWWDLLLHAGAALGFGIIGFLILSILHIREKIAANPITIAVFSFTFAVAIGVLWEIFEFGVDQLLDTNLQKSGLWDTMGDLIVDCVGAGIASVLGFLYLKGWGRSSFIRKWTREFHHRNNQFFQERKRQ